MPSVIINSEGTWLRVARPPGRTARTPATNPAVVPTPEGTEATEEPYDLPDELWRDPSLVGATTTLVSSDRRQVISILGPS